MCSLSELKCQASKEIPAFAGMTSSVGRGGRRVRMCSLSELKCQASKEIPAFAGMTSRVGRGGGTQGADVFVERT